MIERIAVVIFLAVLGSGCAAPKDSFSLTPAAGQESIVRDGVPGLVSSKRHLVVLRPLAPHQASGERPRFVVAVLNRGKKPTTLNIANLSVESTRPRKARLRVYTHEELVAEVEQQRNTAMVLTALAGAAGAVSAANAGYSQTTGSVHATGPYGSSYGSYSATTYNPAVAQEAADANADRTGANMASIEGQAQATLDRLQATILKDHTLMPGEWHGGVVVFEAPQKGEAGAEYAISLRYDDEEHSFLVTQRKQTS